MCGCIKHILQTSRITKKVLQYNVKKMIIINVWLLRFCKEYSCRSAWPSGGEDEYKWKTMTETEGTRGPLELKS